MFIEVTFIDGRESAINVEHIVSVIPAAKNPKQSLITTVSIEPDMGGCEVYTVAHTYTDVMRAIKQSTKVIRVSSTDTTNSASGIQPPKFTNPGMRLT